jgi:hypothetical protein
VVEAEGITTDAAARRIAESRLAGCFSYENNHINSNGYSKNLIYYIKYLVEVNLAKVTTLYSMFPTLRPA